MNEYPYEPAAGQTDTSAAAAKSIALATARIQRMAYYAIAEVGGRGLTAEELAARLGMERTTVQPRTSELKLLGLIRDSGFRRPNKSQKLAIVWVRAA